MRRAPFRLPTLLVLAILATGLAGCALARGESTTGTRPECATLAMYAAVIFTALLGFLIAPLEAFFNPHQAPLKESVTT